MRAYAMLSACALVLIGCTTQLAITANNPADVPQDVRLEVRDGRGNATGQTPLGSVAPKQQLTSSSITVKSGSQVAVIGSIGGYDSSDGSFVTVPHQRNPFPVTGQLGTARKIPTDSEAVAKIQQTLGDVGPDVGFKPTLLTDVLPVYFGALVVADAPTGTTAGQLYVYISPTHYLGSAVDPGSFTWPTAQVSESTVLKSSAAAKTTIATPVFGGMIDTASSNVYELKWSLTNYGQKLRSDADAQNYLKKLNSLPAADLAVLSKTLAAHPTAKLWFLNRMFVVQSGQAETKQLKQLSGSGKLSALNYVDAGAAYSVDDSTDRRQSFTGVVLNVMGTELPVDIAVTTTTQTVAASTSQPGSKTTQTDTPTPDGIGSRMMIMVTPDATYKVGKYQRKVRDVTTTVVDVTPKKVTTPATAYMPFTKAALQNVEVP